VRYPLGNAAASPREYLSDPHSMFAAVRDMRQQDLEVLAVYHSHPTSDAVPSRTDLERNYSPDVVNFIISLKTTPPQVRGWWLTDRDYREANWECV
jgi:proteasome lid subunit RPN8/RPN11